MVSSLPHALLYSRPHARALWLVVVACALGVLGFLSQAAAQTPIPSKVYPEAISLNETVQLSVEVDGDVRNILPPNTTDFRVVGRSTGTSLTFVNGQRQRSMSARFTLAPTRAGVLNTGTATILYENGSSARSSSHNVTVTNPADPSGATTPPAGASSAPSPAPGHSGAPTMPSVPAPAQAPSQPQIPSIARPQPIATIAKDELVLAPPMHESMQTSTDGVDASRPFVVAYASQTSATLGQPFLVEYVYFSPMTGMRYDASDLTEPAFVNAWFRDITDQRAASSMRLGTFVIQGQNFNAQLVRSYMVVPLAEGAFNVAPLALTIEGQSFSRRTGPIAIASPNFSVEVQAPPRDQRPAPEARSVGRLEFSAELSPKVVKVGDMIHLKLEVQGIGSGAHVHMPSVKAPASLRSFAPNDQVDNRVTRSGWVRTEVRRTLSYQATEAGEFTFPSVSFHWYDPWKGEWHSETSPPVSIRVAPNPNAPALDEPVIDIEPTAPAHWTSALPDAETMSHTLGPIAQFRLRPPFVGSPAFFLALIAPMVASSTLFAAQRMRRRRAERAPERRRSNAAKDARAQLAALRFQSANDFSGLARIARSFLAIRLDPSAAGATIAELRAIVAKARTDAHAQEVASLLEAAETARFGGGDAQTFDALKERLKAWLQADEDIV